MYAAELIFESLTYEEIYYTLRTLAYDDCYLSEFFDDRVLEDFLYLLEVYDIVFIASDERILLTQKGNKLFQHLGNVVELNKYQYKVSKEI
jgi:hypothetical protein